MNRQFPCILKGSHIWLAFDNSNATTLDSDHGANKGNVNFEDEAFKNITREYLANTYGKVESKEHAEFVVELAENHGYQLKGSFHEGDDNYFHFVESKKILFFSSGFSDNKQITIPMPPKEVKGIRLASDFGVDIKECKVANNKVKWPKIGDDVVWDGNEYTGTVKAISDGNAWCKLGNGNYLTIQKELKNQKHQSKSCVMKFLI